VRPGNLLLKDEEISRDLEYGKKQLLITVVIYVDFLFVLVLSNCIDQFDLRSDTIIN